MLSAFDKIVSSFSWLLKPTPILWTCTKLTWAPQNFQLETQSMTCENRKSVHQIAINLAPLRWRGENRNDQLQRLNNKNKTYIFHLNIPA